MPFNHLGLCCPPLLLSSVFPSIRIFSNESAPFNRWPKYWSFNFSTSPSSVYSGLFPLGLAGLIFFQPKGLSRVFSNITVQRHQFFSTQLFLESNSHIYTWQLEKIIALTRRTFFGKVMFLLFNMLSRFFIVFLPRSKHLSISWLQSPPAVILEPKKIKSVTLSIVSPSVCLGVMGPVAMIFFLCVCWVLSQVFHSPLSPSSVIADKKLVMW